MDDTLTQTQWWGKFAFEQGQITHWQIGPMELWVRRGSQEWRVAFVNKPEQEQEIFEVTWRAESLPDHFLRFAFEESPKSLHIVPMLGDRAFVVNMEKPFYLAPKNDLFLHISSPLWLQLKTEDPATRLIEIPVMRPSDTWFGPNTREGELCYAEKTFARLSLTNHARRPYRALTSLKLINRTEENLALERIRIPLRNLALYMDETGQFWTQTVYFEKESAQEMAHLKILSELPFAEGKTTLVSEEREKMKNSVVRAFSHILQKDRWRYR